MPFCEDCGELTARCKCRHDVAVTNRSRAPVYVMLKRHGFSKASATTPNHDAVTELVLRLDADGTGKWGYYSRKVLHAPTAPWRDSSAASCEHMVDWLSGSLTWVPSASLVRNQINALRAKSCPVPNYFQACPRDILELVAAYAEGGFWARPVSTEFDPRSGCVHKTRDDNMLKSTAAADFAVALSIERVRTGSQPAGAAKTSHDPPVAACTLTDLCAADSGVVGGAPQWSVVVSQVLAVPTNISFVDPHILCRRQARLRTIPENADAIPWPYQQPRDPSDVFLVDAELWSSDCCIGEYEMDSAIAEWQLGKMVADSRGESYLCSRPESAAALRARQAAVVEVRRGPSLNTSLAPDFLMPSAFAVTSTLSFEIPSLTALPPGGVNLPRNPHFTKPLDMLVAQQGRNKGDIRFA